LTFIHSAGEKNILQTVLLSFFSVFIFSMPSKVIIIVIEFMFQVSSLLQILEHKNYDVPLLEVSYSYLRRGVV